MSETSASANTGTKLGVAHDRAGNVVLNFGPDVPSFLAMPPAMAVELAMSILRHAGAEFEVAAIKKSLGAIFLDAGEDKYWVYNGARWIEAKDMEDALQKAFELLAAKQAEEGKK